MLFSIYLASLITFSSGMELSRRLVDPQLPPQTRCKLFVTTGAVVRGWIKRGADNTLTVIPDSQTAFSEAQEFQWGKPVPNAAYPTLKIDDEEIAFNTNTQESLTIQKRNTPGFTGAAFTAPDSGDLTTTRPTELEVSNRNVKSKLQYCTSKTSKVAILRAGVSDGYGCQDAVVFVRFIPTGTVDTFPQTVKIGVYSKASLAHMGWLQRKERGVLSIASTYESAAKYTLKKVGEIGVYFKIYNGNDVLAETTWLSFRFSNKPGGFWFEWANGNPLILPPTIFHCGGSKGFNDFITSQDPNCIEVIWVISAMVTG